MTTEELEREIELFVADWESGRETFDAHTSGSTGVPKHIELPRELMRDSAHRSIKAFGLDDSSHIHLILSPEYIAGKMAIVRALEAGCTFSSEVPSSTPLQGYGYEKEISLLSAVGSQIDGLYELLVSNGLPKIKHLLLGGAPLSDAQKTKAIQLAEHVWESYGMTETASHIALRELTNHEPEQTGPFYPLEGIKTSIDARGCLCIDMPVAGHLITNDLASLTTDGGFFIDGRIDNVIISGGLKVSPEHVEMVLSPCLANIPYCISAITHANWGQSPVLVIERPHLHTPTILHSDSYMVNGISLQSLCKQILKPQERPTHVIEVPAIPRTEQGKIMRKSLSDLLSTLPVCV